MTSRTLISAVGLHKQFGAVVAARDISVDITAQTVSGLIGTNGAGKTTFVNMLTGYLKPDQGTITFEGTDITGREPRDITRMGIARSFQIPQLFTSLTARENLEIALGIAKSPLTRANEILAQFGLAAFPVEKHAQLLAMKPGSSDNFTRWKANIRGVDLNRQHSAGPKGWEKHKNAPKTPRKPWFEEYPGPGPESEPESRAVAGLIRQGGFDLVLSYHSSGNCFYWYFFQDHLHGSSIMERDRRIVQAMSEYSNYTAFPPERESGNPASHLTAWVVHDLKIPCITVEIGKFTTGYLKMADLSSIWPRTRALPLVAVHNLPGYRKYFTVVFRVDPAQGGWVDEGGEVKTEGRYLEGSEVKLTAVPQEHYVFVNWTENGAVLGTDPVLAIQVNANRILTAHFRPKEYTITAAAGEGGSLEGGGSYAYGAEVTLKAVPHPGYVFDCWLEDGVPVSDKEEYSFRVEGDRFLMAVFKAVSE